MARRGVKGSASLRRLLRRLPDEARKEMEGELKGIATRLLGRAKAETPVRTGALRRALKAKVTPKSLMLRIGLIDEASRKQHFYGYILDQGRKATPLVSKRGKSYTIPAIDRERYNFVFGRRRDFMENEKPKLRAVLTRILQRASRGAGSD